jgi:hypothetical protein
MRVCRALFMTALCAPWITAGAVASPLEPQACATLKTEHDSLVAAGAQSDMDRGPDWAKQNLTPERMGKIERLIAVKEQLSFRCGIQLTARPALKQPPPEVKDKDKPGGKQAQPGDDLIDALGLSSIPPPKKKNAAAAPPAAKKKKRAASEQGP